jgi:molybdopterin-guanine dinucleotide biosynthesis protein A
VERASCAAARGADGGGSATCEERRPYLAQGTMTTLTTVLFVGGESRRMGKDKATLTLNGEPLWSRQIRILRELHRGRVMISARNKPEWCPADIEVALDGPPSRGPLSGLVAAFEKTRTTHLLALAVDVPQMTSAHLEKLWTLAQPGLGVVPVNRGIREALCAVYPIEGKIIAEEILSNNNLSLQSLIDRLAARNQILFHDVPEADKNAYRNFNTPEEWVL